MEICRGDSLVGPKKRGNRITGETPIREDA